MAKADNRPVAADERDPVTLASAMRGAAFAALVTFGLCIPIVALRTEQKERAARRKRQRAESQAKYGDTIKAAIKEVSAAGDLDEGLVAEQGAFARVFASEDAQEGIGAFLGKRTPQWHGR